MVHVFQMVGFAGTGTLEFFQCINTLTYKQEHV